MAVGFAGACASLGVACDVGQSSELANETLTDGPAPSGGGPGGEGDDSPADSTGGNGSNSDPDSDDPPDDPLPDFGGAQGCDYAGDDAAQPFGHHAHSYADGTILPSGSLGQLDAAVADVYGQWRQQFLRQGCGDGRYYVTIGGDDSLTVSEAHGYGMLIAVYMAGFDPDAREFFDGLHAYYRDHPSTGTPPLMAWSQDHSCTTNLGGSSATDGDLDIAYALLLADKQWGSGGTIDYLGEATELLWAITNVELGEGYVYLGDWVGDAYYRQATRSSDFMPNHFAAFEDIVGDGRWENAIGTTYSIMSAVQSSDSGLLPDFAQWVTSDPIPAEPWFLEREWDGDYSYNACRVPWRIGLGYLADGDSRARNLLNPMIGWFQNATGGDPWNMASGYRLWGEPLPGADFPSMTYIAPMGIAAMLDPSRQALLDSIWEAAAYSDLTGVYYDDTLRLLSMIAMSGNWWSPQHAACP
ncbi:MAG: glycosyl hydrolase family 8 [Myxococcota bacterium]